ncbi:MAG: hypothetical protein ACODAQ_08790 [Phycisphaeraceae bacterium]
MLTVDQIQRQFEAGEYEKLLRAVADNGMELPLPLRIRLSQGAVPTIALALRRLVELTYGPTPLSHDMTDALLARQAPDGAFVAGGDGPDPLATATAVAALNQLIADHSAAATAPIIQARDRALAALAQMQDGDGLFHCPDDRDEAQRGLVAAFILSLLAGDEKCRATIRLADLLNWFDQRLHRLDRDTAQLYRLARAADPSRARKPRRRRATTAAAA